ncbi:unnamed protein product [Thelazia callipaeda]|uniref:PDEase domain-containing protein n=1 Tax=Thelazia callipaeda TaxID=103827 RepID=A0A0N5CT26_THECL|nr:unnamed protein product [Thelazia callipaeda]
MFQLCNEANENEEQFWKQPLGAWIKDCISGSDALLPEVAWRTEAFRGRVLRFAELCDGFVFSLLFVFVNSDTLNFIVMPHEEHHLSQTALSLKRFSVLLQNIQSFYRNQND